MQLGQMNWPRRLARAAWQLPAAVIFLSRPSSTSLPPSKTEPTPSSSLTDLAGQVWADAHQFLASCEQVVKWLKKEWAHEWEDPEKRREIRGVIAGVSSPENLEKNMHLLADKLALASRSILKELQPRLEEIVGHCQKLARLMEDRIGGSAQVKKWRSEVQGQLSALHNSLNACKMFLTQPTPLTPSAQASVRAVGLPAGGSVEAWQAMRLQHQVQHGQSAGVEFE